LWYDRVDLKIRKHMRRLNENAEIERKEETCPV
jgi:hypothetical protein